MRILLTNDDGIQSPILGPLAEFLSSYAEVILVAPSKQQSGVGHAFTFHAPLTFQKENAFAVEAYSLSGTPADCVKFAHCNICKDRPIDLVVSGINAGANAGVAVLYSGTVAAAREASLWGIPGLALSIEDLFHENTWPKCKAWLAQIFDNTLWKHIEQCWNVNFPDVTAKWAETTVTTMSQVMYEDEYLLRNDQYFLEGKKQPHLFVPGTDDYELEQNKVCITPLQLNATATADLTGLQMLFAKEVL